MTMTTTETTSRSEAAKHISFDGELWAAFNRAYMRGQIDDLFRFDGRLPVPRAMIVGEAPGAKTDGSVPLYPHVAGCAASRLMRYAEITPKYWLGCTHRVNLCAKSWSPHEAEGTVELLRTWLSSPMHFYRKEPMRVLLLGRRVSDAWGLRGSPPFGRTSIGRLDVAWIPHPSGRCLLYNDKKNQRRAGRAVRWVLRERDTL